MEAFLKTCGENPYVAWMAIGSIGFAAVLLWEWFFEC